MCSTRWVGRWRLSNDFGRFEQIADASLHFLCPMRLNGNATIVGIRRGPKRVRRLLRHAPDGIRLREVLPIGKRIGKTWDLDVVLASGNIKGRAPIQMTHGHTNRRIRSGSRDWSRTRSGRLRKRDGGRSRQGSQECREGNHRTFTGMSVAARRCGRRSREPPVYCRPPPRAGARKLVCWLCLYVAPKDLGFGPQ